MLVVVVVVVVLSVVKDYLTLKLGEGKEMAKYCRAWDCDWL